MKARLAEGSLPGKRTDGYKLGLVVEGGGMQGIISGAMMLRLNELGLHDLFDAVYGASAGAMNGAYFLSRRNEGLEVYTEQCVEQRFLDLSLLIPEPVRSWTASVDSVDEAGPRPAMDLDYLVYRVMDVECPIDYEAILKSPIPLKIVVSSLDLLRPVTISNFVDKAEIQAALAASATVPEVAGPPRMVRGQRCVDAAVFEPVPVASAIEDGCTHTLVLCTRLPRARADATVPVNRREELRRMAKKALDQLVKRTVLNPGYMRSAWKSDRSDVTHIHDELLYAAHYNEPNEAQAALGAYVLPLYPTSTRGTSPICQDVAKLLAAREEGIMTVDRLVGVPLGIPMPPTTTSRSAGKIPKALRVAA